MSGAICRVGDLVTGTCQASAPGHPRAFTGHWVVGSPKVTANGIGVIRTGDTGITDCGHTIIATVGSTLVSSDGIGVVRVGDPVGIVQGGFGTAITGANNTTSG